MRNLRIFLIFWAALFIEKPYPVVTLALKDISKNFSYDIAGYSAAARMDKELSFGGRIVGGFVTSIANYPYQVSLLYHNVHICGGSIVAQNIILTAAHCIEQPWDTAAFRVRAGSSTHLHGGQLVGVRHIFKHEAYSTSTLDSDVALLVLNKNLIYTRTVQPVELAGWGEQLPNSESELIVLGWGLTTETGSISPVLNYVAVHLINQSTCSKNYQYIATITEKMFCAGNPDGGKDSCQGDSGGPLVSYFQSSSSSSSSSTSSPSSTLSLKSSLPSSHLTATKTKTKTKVIQSQTKLAKAKQYGIVSWGVGCAEKSYPGVYANVATLRPWIDEKLNAINYL